jgi:hypothetical protein
MLRGGFWGGRRPPQASLPVFRYTVTLSGTPGHPSSYNFLRRSRVSLSRKWSFPGNSGGSAKVPGLYQTDDGSGTLLALMTAFWLARRPGEDAGLWRTLLR